MKHVHTIKRCASLCLIALLAAVLCLGVFAAEAPRFVVTSSASQVSWGEEFTVEVSIANNPGISAADFTLDFDSAKFEIIKIEGKLPGWVCNKSSGQCTWMQLNNLEDANPVLVTATLRAKKDVPVGDLSISVKDTDLSGVIYNEDGTIADNPGYTPAAPTPSTVTTTPSADHEHTGPLTGVTAATCTAEGYTGDQTCTVCGMTVKGTTTPKLPHETEVNGYVAPTCTSEGRTGTTTCKNCSTVVKADEAIPALGHTPSGKAEDVVEVTKAATCTEKGTQVVKCVRHAACGETLTVEIPALGHDWDTAKTEVTKAATCTEAGEKQTPCKRCNNNLVETIDALGHSWDEGKVTKEATVDAEGVRTYTCTVDGATRTEAIPKLAPTPAPAAPVTTSPNTDAQDGVIMAAVLVALLCIGLLVWHKKQAQK